MNCLKMFKPQCGHCFSKQFPPHGRSLEIPREVGEVLKAKILKQPKYETKLEFRGGKGAQQKPSMGEGCEYGTEHSSQCVT